ncbi:transposase [Pseudoflavonifractor phocaeensis]|uniref:transposase n=1 Tax=Pseudoflavonifractor phocaeensis TaxID=1870988 RepID=UPI00195C1C78|nr:transposase [Pseudoflavonifractor phocaeensis]MBM6925694.1 transposase [Pseudoflavonifractor phocaeensis]
MPDHPTRKSLHLKTWDYSSGGTYFLTFCTTNHRCLLSTIRRGDPCGRPLLDLTPLGECVSQAIRYVIRQHKIQLEHWVIMPNHVHLLLTVNRATTRVAPTPVGGVVGAIKSRAVVLAKEQGLDAARLWQRGYHDHIVREETDFLCIWTYIDQNPQKWELDRYYTPT